MGMCRWVVVSVKVIAGPAGEQFLYVYTLISQKGSITTVERWGRDRLVPTPGSSVMMLAGRLLGGSWVRHPSPLDSVTGTVRM